MRPSPAKWKTHKLGLNCTRKIMKCKTTYEKTKMLPKYERMNYLSWNRFEREKWSLLKKTPSPSHYLQISNILSKIDLENIRSTHNDQYKILSNQVQEHSSNIYKISSQSFIYCWKSKSQKSIYNEWVHEYI